VQQRKFCLKISLNLYALVVGMCCMHAAHANNHFTLVNNIIVASVDGQTKRCILDATPAYAVESADGQAVMVSERGYVSISDLKDCRTGASIHVSEIPEGVGFLSDINLPKGIYIALDFVSIQPNLYLATVARVRTKRNLVTLSGAYVGRKANGQLDSAAFSASGDAGSSVISSNGRFVAPNGQIDCSRDAYPGIWDIRKNKRVFMNKNACDDLFQRNK
jgi:hypothetical protein